MTVTKKSHALFTYRFYPRAYYYHKRGQDLYKRFRQLIAVFPDGTHVKEDIEDIEGAIVTYEKPPKILVHGNHDLDLSDIVVSTAPMQEPFRPFIGNGISIEVIYVNIDKVDTQGLQTTEHVIKSFKNDEGSDTINQHRLFFVSCINDGGLGDWIGYRQAVSELLRHINPECSWEEQLVVVQQDLKLKDKISEYLEKEHLIIFDKMRKYLQRFLTTVQGHIKGETIEQLCVQECLHAFVSNKWRINDIINRRESESDQDKKDTAGLPAEERYLIYVMEELGTVFKCAIAQPLSIRYKLPILLCNDMLTEMNSAEKFKDALSSSTKSILKRLFRFREFESGYRTPAKTNKNEYMVTAIANDFSKSVVDIEKILKNTREMTVIMEKMIFEINGYFKLSILAERESVKTCTRPSKHLMEAILGIDHVYGVGTIYGQLEIHLTEEDEEAKRRIQEILQNNFYARPFTIKTVEKRPQDLADLQHEHGKEIYTKMTDTGTPRRGTLGCFVEDQQKTNLYALTCAHVVRWDTNIADQDVYVEERQRDRILGISTAGMALCPGESSCIDIAAVKIIDDIKRQCIRYLKDDDGKIKPALLADSNEEELNAYESLHVYKYGASTDLTNGMICSSGYMVKARQERDLQKFVILVESLPANTAPFAQKGDSGSIVCLNKPGGEEIIALSMISGGEFKLSDDIDERCLTFTLSRGLKEILKKSGKQLYLCT